MRNLLALTLFSATVAYTLGITLPLIEVKRLFVLTDTPSLLGIIAGLWLESDRALAIVIALFSVVFPACKLIVLHLAAYGGAPGGHRIPAVFRAMSNWSMLDVVLVALVIFAAKTSGVATAITKPGLWFFAASAVLTVAASWLAKREAAIDAEAGSAPVEPGGDPAKVE